MRVVDLRSEWAQARRRRLLRQFLFASLGLPLVVAFGFWTMSNAVSEAQRAMMAGVPTYPTPFLTSPAEDECTVDVILRRGILERLRRHRC